MSQTTDSAATAAHLTEPLAGLHWIANQGVPPVNASFRATDARTGAHLEPAFGEATSEQIAAACLAAQQAFCEYRQADPETRAALLEAIADEVMAAGDALLERCEQETGLPRPRLQFERQRTVNQARLFAQVVRDGSWAEPRIDHAIPNPSGPNPSGPSPAGPNPSGPNPTGPNPTGPSPTGPSTAGPSPAGPDCRSLWLPVGPVAVFGAANFPLAISVVGNDTIAALAAGCPVVVKAHPGHPGTCEILARCLNRAISRQHLHPGLFSLLHGAGHAVGQALVQDPHIQAVGFTGSLAGGRALFDAVCRRPQLIPVYAEMGSVNPVFFFPQALSQDRWRKLVTPLAGSITAGCGQMCTQPGLLLGPDGEAWQAMRQAVAEKVAAENYTLLHPGIAGAYRQAIAARSAPSAGLDVTTTPQDHEDSACQVGGAVFATPINRLLEHPALEEEIFGPTTVFVACDHIESMLQYARQMKGSLTASVFATPEEYDAAKPLIDILQTKVGRIIFNGFPTGVQVNHAMMHGGPSPAAIGSFTSIGTGSIKRFARPVCLQQFPTELLPPVLRDATNGPTLRMIDGRYQFTGPAE